MGASPVRLPAGFELEESQQQVNLPDGFVLESESQDEAEAAPAPKKRQPGFWSEAKGAVTGAVEGVGHLANKIGRGDIAGASRDLIQPNLDAINRAGESFGEGKYWSAARHGIAGAVPLIGPMAERAGDLAEEGNYAGAAGSAVGNAALLAVSEIPKGVRAGARVAGRAGESTAMSLGKSALKPTQKRAAGGAVHSMLEEGTPITEGGVQKAKGVTEAMEGKIEGALAEGPGGRSANVGGRVAKNARALKEEFSTRPAPTESIRQLDKVVKDFYEADRPGGPISRPGKAARNMTLDEAQATKKAGYKELGETAYGPQTSKQAAKTQSKKMVIRSLREVIADLAPEAQPYLQRQGKSINLTKALEQALNRATNAGHGGVVPIGVGLATHGLPGGLVGGGLHLAYKILRDPGVKSQLAIAIYKGSKKLKSIGEAKKVSASLAERLATFAEQNPKGPKTPVGLQIDFKGGKDSNWKTTPEPIPTTNKHIGKMVAAVIEDMGADSPESVNAHATRVFGPKWNTNNKGVVIEPEKAFVMGKQELQLSNERSSSGRVPTKDAFWGRTAKGESIRNWYREGIKEWADEIGHEQAIRALDEMAIASPQTNVQNAATQSLKAFFEHKAGRTDWSGTHLDDVGNKAFDHLTGISRRDAVIDFLNGLGKPSGPKVEPFAAWSRSQITGVPGDSPVIDRHSFKSATGRYQGAQSQSDFQFADARHRIDADRLGLDYDQQQAMNWGGQLKETAEAKRGPGAMDLFEDTQEPKTTNPDANYIDFIRQAEKDAGGREKVFGKETGDTSFDVAAMEGASSAMASRGSISHITPKVAAEAVRQLASTQPGGGGFTINRQGTPYDKGFSVVPFMEGSERSYPLKKASSKEIMRIAEENADILGQEGYDLGGWKDGDTSFIEISKYELDLNRALELARQFKQKAIFDHASKQSIPMQGIGSMVVMNDGRVFFSDFVPTQKANLLPNHLSIVEKHGLNIDDVSTTGWVEDGVINLGGGGTVGKGGFTLGEYEAGKKARE